MLICLGEGLMAWHLHCIFRKGSPQLKTRRPRGPVISKFPSLLGCLTNLTMVENTLADLCETNDWFPKSAIQYFKCSHNDFKSKNNLLPIGSKIKLHKINHSLLRAEPIHCGTSFLSHSSPFDEVTIRNQRRTAWHTERLHRRFPREVCRDTQV